MSAPSIGARAEPRRGRAGPGGCWLLLLACGAAGAALAQSGGGFDIRRSTIDAGGGRSSGAGFELTATIGQPDAGFASGGGFELRGGFWPANTAVAPGDTLFSDGFE